MKSAIKHALIAVVGFLFGASGVHAATTSEHDVGENLTKRHANDPVDDNVGSDPSPTAANSNDDLPTCEWETNSINNATATYALCPSADQKPIAGSCTCAGTEDLKTSVPVENVTIFGSDPPDNAESWYSTDGTTGWSCVYQSSCNTVTAHALCCGS